MTKTLVALCAAALALGRVAGAVPTGSPPVSYPYRDPVFTRFVADSYRGNGAGSPDQFYLSMEAAFRRAGAVRRGKRSLDLAQTLVLKGEQLAHIHDTALRTQREMAEAAWLHHLIKTWLPRFSLAEGFEFKNAARRGERQCLLQSVLLAGMLQRSGADAGVVMVNRSLAGRWSNNGHCVVLLRLPVGRDVLVDCSEPKPFARHQGLFTWDPWRRQYQYVAPAFKAPGSAVIASYTALADGRPIPVARVRPLDTAFIRSQFDYYRGERTAGGLLAPPVTPQGLAAEAAALRRSVAECPQNPLAVYMLGRVYLRQKQAGPARVQLQAAQGLYERFGWVPQGMRAAQAEAKL